MSVVSELSVLELDAERGELLPEREALQPVSFDASNVATVDITQSIGQSYSRTGAT